MTATLSHRNSTEFIGAVSAVQSNGSKQQKRQSYLEPLQHANGRDIDSCSSYYFLSPHPFPFCSLAKWASLQMLEVLESAENDGGFYGHSQVFSTGMKKLLPYPLPRIHDGNSVWPNNMFTGSWFLLKTGEAGCLTKWFVRWSLSVWLK